MSHCPRPFFKKVRGLWYVEINRKQINLGPDREEAFRQYHQLMARPRETADLRNRRVGDSNPPGVMPACLRHTPPGHRTAHCS